MNEMNNIVSEIEVKLGNIKSIKDLNDLKVEYLGKKGLISNLTSKMKDLSIEEKKEFGKSLNELKTKVNLIFDEIKTKLE